MGSNGCLFELPVFLHSGGVRENQLAADPVSEEDQAATRQARDQMVKAVADVGAGAADVFVRPSPKHYKCFKIRAKLAPIKELVRAVKRQQQEPGCAAVCGISLLVCRENVHNTELCDITQMFSCCRSTQVIFS